METYEQLRNRQRKEYNAFPIIFALTEDGFRRGMEKLGVKSEDELIGIGYGGIIRKSDADAFREMLLRHSTELQQAKDADKTGNGFIKSMFAYELAEQEYGYTYRLADTLDALGYTLDQVENDPRLKAGLDAALKKYRD